MKKTLLLVFIHGFKGADDTFVKFPDHLRILIEDALPNINVVAIQYPTYETRGELNACVASFKEWLQNKVIDLEVAAKAPSPTVDPSVRVILCGHSMGGIVAAETLMKIAREQTADPLRAGHSTTPPPGVGNNTTSERPSSSQKGKANLSVPDKPERSSSAPPRSTKAPVSNPEDGSADPTEDTPTFLFPYIQGILAFDTPYLGIHPGVVAHGAEQHYNTAASAYSAYNQASKMFGFGSKSNTGASNSSRALPAANATGAGWGKYAMFAGGVAAVAAAGGAAWVGRSQLTEGWSWATSHLEFVGCLARGAELAQRLDATVKLCDRCHIGFADFYTRLGEKAGQSAFSGQVLGEERTFCVVPNEAKESQKGKEKGESPPKRRKVEPKANGKGTWLECVNKKAENEIAAHRTMFTIREHPGYYSMCDKARKMIVGWVDKEWYDGSEEAEAEEGAEDDTAAEDEDEYGAFELRRQTSL